MSEVDLKDEKIVLPEYWDGLIDPETITVSLTQIGSSQDLIVDKIEWGKIFISNQEMEQTSIVIIKFASRRHDQP